MKLVIQRSGPASVTVEDEVIGKISEGLVVLLGIHEEDQETDIDYLVEKLINLRLFTSEDKHFQLSILDHSKELLVISQFTLYASTRKGRRPDFSSAMTPKKAEEMYGKFIQKLESKGLKVEKGKFGAMMDVKLENRGPVTIIIDSKDGKR